MSVNRKKEGRNEDTCIYLPVREIEFAHLVGSEKRNCLVRRSGGGGGGGGGDHCGGVRVEVGFEVGGGGDAVINKGETNE